MPTPYCTAAVESCVFSILDERGMGEHFRERWHGVKAGCSGAHEEMRGLSPAFLQATTALVEPTHAAFVLFVPS